MISRNDKGLFAAHWDWFVCGLGALVLVVGLVVVCLPPGEEEGVQSGLAPRGKKGGLQEVDLKPYEEMVALFDDPGKITEPSETGDSYLASGRRVFCEQGDKTSEKKACGRPIPFGVKVCPYADCGVTQPEEVKVEVDTDGDGLFDEWEKKYGLNPADPTDAEGDLDKDGFTNLEERDAGTDPVDAASHPDYRDSLKLVLPLRETTLPFYFEKVMQLPGGNYRFYFKDPNKKNDYGQKGKVYDPKTGEEIGKTGYIVKSYAHKVTKREIAGDKSTAKKLTREIDISTATIERKSDHKVIVIAVGERNKPVDTQAQLVYERGEAPQTLSVVKGQEITLGGEKFTVADILRDGKAVRVSLASETHGKKTLEALEQ